LTLGGHGTGTEFASQASVNRRGFLATLGAAVVGLVLPKPPGWAVLQAQGARTIFPELGYVTYVTWQQTLVLHYPAKSCMLTGIAD